MNRHKWNIDKRYGKYLQNLTVDESILPVYMIDNLKIYPRDLYTVEVVSTFDEHTNVGLFTSGFLHVQFMDYVHLCWKFFDKLWPN